MTNDTGFRNDDEPTDSIDCLINRLIDGDSNRVVWNEFERAAGDAADLWKRLASEQWLQRRLTVEFEAATERAVALELPRTIERDQSSMNPNTPGRRFGALAAQFAGWAAAAALAIAWAVTLRTPDRIDATPPRIADGSSPAQIDAAAPEKLLASYLAASHVIGEVEPVLLQTSESGDLQEVIYIRRIVERQQVERLLRPVWDENANLMLQPASQAEIIRASY